MSLTSTEIDKIPNTAQTTQENARMKNPERLAFSGRIQGRKNQPMTATSPKKSLNSFTARLSR
jgi:hypothetical protein